jgi:hypothetical protein
MSAKPVKLLTNAQRSFLGGLADGAHRLMVSRGAIDPHEESCTPWRRRHAREATADLHPQAIGWTISEAPAFCFDALKARFEALAGQTDKALETLTGTPNDIRQMAHNISVVAKACGVGDAYIAGICKRQSRGARNGWTTLSEGKAVLTALTKHAASQAKKAKATHLAAAGAV